jgi:hypothetical protein
MHIRKIELAQKLGIGEDEVRRILHPRYRTRLDRIEAALAALGTSGGLRRRRLI